MRGESHRRLGRYLAAHYMDGVPRAYIRAFLLGCIEPDRNPATYLKGSIRYQWLRGHNYLNALHFMRHISRRLEAREQLRLLDYYTLGKLIHYTTDAFTYAHNAAFPKNISEHREYEAALQEHFLDFLQGNPQVQPRNACSIMDAIYRYHREYSTQPRNVDTDARYALTACCCVLALLFAHPILCAAGTEDRA